MSNLEVIGSLIGVNGNAFAIMHEFKTLAREQGYSEDEISVVLDECVSGDYDHLVQTILANMTEEL